jgi:hypothetical protein
MPTVRIPLVGQFNSRELLGSSAAKDQYFSAALFQVLDNPVTGKRSVYVHKRPGWAVGSTPSVGSSPRNGIYAFRTLSIQVSSSGVLSVFRAAGVTSLFYNSTNSGTMDGVGGDVFITETTISNTVCYLITEPPSAGFYLMDDARSQTSYTGTLTNTSPIVTTIASTAGMYSGQKISGTGIPASTRILTVDSATQITMNANATANGAQTITKEPLAKITSANFPTAITGPLIPLDGYVFIAQDGSQKIWNSDLNSVSNWTSTNFISATTFSENIVTLAKVGRTIISCGGDGLELLGNAGNATGSPLSRIRGVPFGVGNARAVTTLDDTLYAVGSGPKGRAVIAMSESGAFKVISTSAVDSLISSKSADRMDSFYAFGGHVVIYQPTGTPSASMMYSGGIWSNAGFDSTYRIAPVGTSSTLAIAIHDSSGTGTDDSTFAISESSPVYQDNGVTYNLVIRTSRIDHETDKRKFVHGIRLIADDQASGTVTLECSDDDYGSWVTLGTFDLTSHTKKITRCGSYKGGRAYRLTHATNAAFRGEALEIDYTVGSA